MSVVILVLVPMCTFSCIPIPWGVMSDTQRVNSLCVKAIHNQYRHVLHDALDSLSDVEDEEATDQNVCAHPGGMHQCVCICVWEVVR